MSDGAADLPAPAIRDRIIYYVMPDRFENGDPRNDYGGHAPDAGIEQHGLDKTAASFYHGGDLAGLTSRLDYIKKLGMTAIWSTPVARNRALAPDGSGAGYHGYWPLGFDEVDPHLGTSEEMKRFVAAAHEKGMKVVLDVVANHSADVISYAECANACQFRATPAYTPVIGSAWSSAKSPAWLNDAEHYHNLGNMNDGVLESLLHGDFGGLDDLDSASPAVISGLGQVFKDWIARYDVDAFRLDAAKHVDDAFWQQWWPEVRSYAQGLGKSDFYAYAEALDGDPEVVSRFTRQLGIPATQDFGFMDAARRVFSQGAATDALRWLFENDDYYTDADSNAYYLTTMLSSHDSGRIGAFLVQDNPDASDGELLGRTRLAHAFLLAARGVPAVYYGDEQGFTGINARGYTNFETARQDMFPSQTPEYGVSSSSTDHTYNKQIGSDSTPAADNFQPKHPLFGAIAELARLRRSLPELRRGSQLHRYSSAEQGGGLYAFSRILRPNNRELLFVVNTSEQAKTATIRTLHETTRFVQKHPGSSSAKIKSNGDGDVTLTIPALDFQLWMAGEPLPARKAPPSVAIVGPARDFGFGRFWIEAALGESTFAEVKFY
ncbi:MAG TPA: alpha-amylase family glycosyl hydrolase, partial [Polyangiaceae bacterium]|nr:alpha-amylase family glycosyl hydrolase [Polyangiaceae bacterium]